MNTDKILELQRKYFASGATFDIKSRIEKLKRLYQAVKHYEKDICNALYADLGKSEYESYMCEVGLTLTEIRYMIKHVKVFASKRRVKTPLAQFWSHSYEQSVPLGNVFIMSPWNYPFLLTIEPLADALAAGNTVILKPSAYSPETGKIIEKIVSECFDEREVAVIIGGRKENKELLNKKFDMIFFTGSQAVGKEVLRYSAETLTPVVLELGGKSPCIVDETANIKLAAKRIVFGKFLNCGQTCVAPDYVLCQNTVKDILISSICDEIKKQYGENPLSNDDYGKIVNEKHFARLLGLTVGEKTVIGGKGDRRTLRIEPTVLDDVSLSSPVMSDEIFGPILPVIGYDDIESAADTVNRGQKPLALYIFSQNKKNIEKIRNACRYGGGCINDTVIHLATSEMGFGGVGESGMGSYHGKRGFDAFSHRKSTVDKKTIIDIPMRYQPYDNKFFEFIIRMFLR